MRLSCRFAVELQPINHHTWHLDLLEKKLRTNRSSPEYLHAEPEPALSLPYRTYIPYGLKYSNTKTETVIRPYDHSQSGSQLSSWFSAPAAAKPIATHPASQWSRPARAAMTSSRTAVDRRQPRPGRGPRIVAGWLRVDVLEKPWKDLSLRHFSFAFIFSFFLFLFLLQPPSPAEIRPTAAKCSTCTVPSYPAMSSPACRLNALLHSPLEPSSEHENRSISIPSATS